MTSGEIPMANTKEMEEKKALKENLDRIMHKIVVLSGKGGVGKSTVAVNLAVSLAEKGAKVGLLDVDVHGPSVPKMLGIEDEKIGADSSERLIPVDYKGFMKVMSIGFMLGNSDEAVIWRGPLKYSVIKQFLKDVEWGDLDYLVVDSPPGTGDEPLSVCQLIGDASGAVVVTTPQDVALTDVRKSITFCNSVNMPIIGVVENMSGFVCPECGKKIDIFKTGGGKKMAEDMNVDFIGNIPIESGIVERGDSGSPFVLSDAKYESVSTEAFSSIVDNILNKINKN